MPSMGSYRETAKTVAGAALEKACLSMADIAFTRATGYGSGAVDFADETTTDISCHAAGVHHLFPRVRTVVEYRRAVQQGDQGRQLGEDHRLRPE